MRPPTSAVATGLTGTDLALQTAQIALLSDDLSKLRHLLDLSRQAMRDSAEPGVLARCSPPRVGLTIAGILHSFSGALLHELSSIPR